MKTITGDTQWLLDIYRQSDARPVPNNVEKIKLNQLVSKLGFLYEKFRNAIDYNDEHLVRRNALERLLRRQVLFLKEPQADKISQALIYEFIRARYLPNDTLPETIISEVGAIIQKYLVLARFIEQQKLPNEQKLLDWTIANAACEIDEYLVPITKPLAMANYMYSRMVDTIAVTNTDLDEREKNLQIHIAVLRTLLKADADFIRYRLLLLYFPSWSTISGHELAEFCQHVIGIKAQLDRHLDHPIGFQMLRVMRPQSVFFTILKETIETTDDPAALMTEESTFAARLSDICTKNYHKIKNRLVGSIFRVIIYILFTKTILAFLIELPYDRFILGQIHWQALAINVFFHPALMFLIAMTISVPGVRNTQIIIEEITKIISGAERKVVLKVKKSMRRGSTAYIVFNTIYAIMFAISFGIVIRILSLLDFNIVSGLMFIFFLTVVSFFGFRLRNLAKQLSVLPRKDNLVNFIIDFFSLPIIRVGRFLSNNFARVNIFLFILDFIIETPFKLLVEFLERAMSFVKDKREEIVD